MNDPVLDTACRAFGLEPGEVRYMDQPSVVEAVVATYAAQRGVQDPAGVAHTVIGRHLTEEITAESCAQIRREIDAEQ